MNLFGMMDVSGSALRAERIRAEVTASNMANAETTRTEEGGPYKRQQVLFEQSAPHGTFSSMFHQSAAAPAGGVNIAGVSSEGASVLRRYDPTHPDADGDGFVSYPDINPATEMVDMLGATRAYGLNVSALQAEKGMLSASLDILK